MSDPTDDSILRSGSLRWMGRTVGFTVGACLFVAATVLILFVVTEHGSPIAGSGRTRSVLALVLFVTAIGVPTYLLAVRSFRTAG